MNNIALIYFTRRGSTERYANWIAEESGNIDLFPLKKANLNELSKYDTIIYGAPVYRGNFLGSQVISRNYEVLKDKRIIFFSVGLTAPGDDATYKQVIDRNFKEGERDRFEYYHFLGEINFKRLSLWERATLRLLKKFILKKPEAKRSEVERHFLDAYGGRLDFTHKDYVKPFVEMINS